MNKELLKDFHELFYIYCHKSNYLDVVGTELYDKMCELENVILTQYQCDIANNPEQYSKCLLCGKHRHHYEIAARNIHLNESTVRYLFLTNFELQDRLLKYQDKLIKDRNYPNICIKCCEYYNYDPVNNCFKSDVYTWTKRIIEQKPIEICNDENQFESHIKKGKRLRMVSQQFKEEGKIYGVKSMEVKIKKWEEDDKHAILKRLLEYYYKTGKHHEANRIIDYYSKTELNYWINVWLPSYLDSNYPGEYKKLPDYFPKLAKFCYNVPLPVRFTNGETVLDVLKYIRN